MNIIKFNNSILKYGGKWLNSDGTPTPTPPVDPYNPLNLPPNTIRVKFTSGYTPTMGDSQTLVDSTNNIWDIYKSSNRWGSLFMPDTTLYNTTLLEVLGANTSNVTNMRNIFWGCISLTSVPLFDTSNVRDMAGMFNDCRTLISVPLYDTSNVTTMATMFYDCISLSSVPLFNTSKVTHMGTMFAYCTALTTIPLFDTSNVTIMEYMLQNCTNLTTIPLFDTSKVTNMDYMCQDCVNVESGALALYQQASSQTTPPNNHSYTIYNCGKNTTSGAAELAQIPNSWGGKGA